MNSMLTPGDSLSVILVADKSFNSWPDLLPHLHTLLKTLKPSYEIFIVAPNLDENALQIMEQNHCTVISSSIANYGDRLRTAFRKAMGEYIITLDIEQAQPFDCLYDLWRARGTGEIIIGSRYIPRGRADMPIVRRFMSRVLNLVFSRGLNLHVRDMSSAFRLYKSHAIKMLALESKSYEILQEILVKALMSGYQINEIPLHYHSPDPGYLRAIHFGWSYVGTFARLWKLRNSIASADYDDRAYDALMPPQRYWQRQRYKIITAMIDQNGRRKCVDIGCGSSRIIHALPQGSIALDILFRKLRFARRFGHPTVQGSIFHLPLPSEAFPSVLCSQVIEHIPRENVLDELSRVLEPGGLLILGTPDYANWEWRVIEMLYKTLLPQAYADEHITHYTYAELINEFVSKRGFKLETTRYILRGELILGLRKPLHRS